MIAIRLGTRSRVNGLMIGATNLDIGSYEQAGGGRVTGPTVTLSIPDAAPVVVGKGSLVSIGGTPFLVDDVVVAGTATDCEVQLSETAG